MGYSVNLYIGYLLPEAKEDVCYDELFHICVKNDSDLNLFSIDDAYEGHYTDCDCGNTWFVGYRLKEHESPQQIYDMQMKLENNPDLRRIVTKIDPNIQVKVVGFGSHS
jgi:hypothetical protein